MDDFVRVDDDTGGDSDNCQSCVSVCVGRPDVWTSFPSGVGDTPVKRANMVKLESP